MAETPSSIAARLAALPYPDAVQAVGTLPAVTLVELLRHLDPDPRLRESELVRREIHRRTVEDLKRAVARVARGILSRDFYEDLVYGALLAFFADSSAFVLSRSRRKKDGGDADLRAHLANKVQWRTKSLLRRERKTPASARFEASDEHFAAAEPAEDPATDPAGERRQAQYRAIWLFRDRLSPADRAVFDAYFLDQHPGQSSDRLPTPVIRQLKAICRVSDASSLRHRKQHLQSGLKDFLTRQPPDHGPS